MEYLFGVKIFVSGDEIDNSASSLIIMNHRTRLDWLFFWNALFRMDPWLLTTEKISLKGILKYLPGAGRKIFYNLFKINRLGNGFQRLYVFGSFICFGQVKN